MGGRGRANFCARVGGALCRGFAARRDFSLRIWCRRLSFTLFQPLARANAPAHGRLRNLQGVSRRRETARLHAANKDKCVVEISDRRSSGTRWKIVCCVVQGIVPSTAQSLPQPRANHLKRSALSFPSPIRRKYETERIHAIRRNWTCGTYRVVDKAGKTVDFLRRAQRDKHSCTLRRSAPSSLSRHGPQRLIECVSWALCGERALRRLDCITILVHPLQQRPQMRFQ